MRKAFEIARIALVRLIRDRSNIFFVFVLPIMIIILIGAQFGGGFTPTAGLVVEEGAGPLGEDLAEAIEANEELDVERFDSQSQAITATERGSIQATVVIPNGYDEKLRTGEIAVVGYFSRPDAVAYQSVIAAEVADQSSFVRAARFAEDEAAVTFDEGLATAEVVEPSVAGVAVETTTVGESDLPFTDIGQFDLGASSQLVLFMYLTGLTGSAAIIETRRLGVARRMLSTPTTAGSVVSGEALGRFGVVMVQGLYILFATLIVFGVSWGDPLGAAAVMVAFGAVCAGTALLMGTVFRNDQQAAGVGVIAGIGVAALGGCMVPIEFYSDTMVKVAHITPHAWALDAFATLVRDGGSIADITTELAVLTAFAAVLITVAGFRLRRAMTTF